MIRYRRDEDDEKAVTISLVFLLFRSFNFWDALFDEHVNIEPNHLFYKCLKSQKYATTKKNETNSSFNKRNTRMTLNTKWHLNRNQQHHLNDIILQKTFQALCPVLEVFFIVLRGLSNSGQKEGILSREKSRSIKTNIKQYDRNVQCF